MPSPGSYTGWRQYIIALSNVTAASLHQNDFLL
jgi:hypothetical protein